MADSFEFCSIYFSSVFRKVSQAERNVMTKLQVYEHN